MWYTMWQRTGPMDVGSKLPKDVIREPGGNA